MGLGEHRGVAVGGPEPDHDLVARPHLLVAEHRVAGGRAPELLDRRDVPQQLLDRGRQVLRVVGEPRPQAVLVQGEHRARHGVARRLVPRHHQQQPEHLELGVAEPLAVDLGRDDAAHEVVARLGPPGVGHRLAVGHHPRQRLHGRLGVLRRPRVVGAEQGVAPLEDQVAVVAGHAEQVGQHPQRHLGRDGGHQVELAGRPGEDVRGVALDRRPQPLDRPGREDRLEDPPQPAVLRVVHVEHHLAEDGQAVLGERRHERAAHLRREPVLVAVDLAHERVRGGDPEAGAVDELEQRVVAQHPLDRGLVVPGDAARGWSARRTPRAARPGRTSPPTSGRTRRGRPRGGRPGAASPAPPASWWRCPSTRERTRPPA